MTYQVIAEHTEPGRKAKYRKAPPWVTEGPTAPVVSALAPDSMVYTHQAIALEKLSTQTNLVISTGTASGKTLIFQVATLDRLHKDPLATAIAIYPIKALSRDQMIRWKQAAEMTGLDPSLINKIDGDVAVTERQNILNNSRIVLMTPDIIHSWLLSYSDRNTNTRSPGVNATKVAARNFISNLKVVIIDEAHAYETAFGANMAFLMRRLRAKRQELQSSKSEPLFIAASATILNPKEHLQNLTGLSFEEVMEKDNGAPRAPLTVQHVAGRTIGQGSEEDTADIIRQIMKEHPEGSYIAFADGRQKVERIAALVEPTPLSHEEDIISESEQSMSYRSGLQARELIEEKLRNSTIRGVVSTSALEMGIDIPDLTVGINVGLPNTIKRTRQRAGRVGRTTPGLFIIIEDEFAFQFEEGGLSEYWKRPVEPANLYLTNRFLQRVQAECLRQELDNKQVVPDMHWPEGFAEIAEATSPESPYQAPESLRNDKKAHEHSMRSVDEKDIAVYIEGDFRKLTSMSKVEAMTELYTWATYHHAKRPYAVLDWHEEGNERHTEPHVVLRQLQKGDRRTSRIMETSAKIHPARSTIRENAEGLLGYADSQGAAGIEMIVGATGTKEEKGKKQTTEEFYRDKGKPDIVRETPTDMTFLTIDLEWFANDSNRESVITALKEIMCHLDNVAPEEVATAHKNIVFLNGDRETPATTTVALWDRTAGGLGLSRRLYDNLPKYATRLREITEDPTRATDQVIPIPLRVAQGLEQWTNSLPDSDTPPRESGQSGGAVHQATPTSYMGVLFRSKLEARWALHFDNEAIRWEYEPQPMGNWVPDFRLTINGETVYAEVKPVTQLPETVSQRIDQSTWQGTALILGTNTDCAWLRRNGQWDTNPKDLL